MDRLTKFLVRVSGRSWWQAVYANGLVLSEWNVDWKDVRKDMVKLFLICPNGEVAKLEATPYGFVQLKVGRLDVAIMGGEGGRYRDAHIIGVVHNTKGDCQCCAWEVKERRLISFEDNVLNMKYRNIGMLYLPVQGVRI